MAKTISTSHFLIATFFLFSIIMQELSERWNMQPETDLSFRYFHRYLQRASSPMLEISIMIRLFLKDFHLEITFLPGDPYTELSPLHSHAKSVQLHKGNKVHIHTVHFIPICIKQ